MNHTTKALAHIRRIYNNPSSAMTVALLALVIAVTGGAYGAIIPNNNPPKIVSRPPAPILACVAHKHGTMYIAAKCAPKDRQIQGPRWKTQQASTQSISTAKSAIAATR